MPIQDSVDRGPADSEDFADLRNGHVPLLIKPLRGLHLISRQGRGAATSSAVGASGSQTGVGALPDQVALKFGESGEDMEDQPATRRGGVDRLLQGPEADVAFAQHVQLVDEVPNGPAEPVESPDNEGVPRPDLVEELVEFGTVLMGSRHGVDEHPVTAGRIQGIDLESRVLVGGGDARVPEEMTHDLNVVKPAPGGVYRHIEFGPEFRYTIGPDSPRRDMAPGSTVLVVANTNVFATRRPVT